MILNIERKHWGLTPMLWLLVSVAVSEQELSSWSQWMMLDISSWTTQSMMRLRQVSTM